MPRAARTVSTPFRPATAAAGVQWELDLAQPPARLAEQVRVTARRNAVGLGAVAAAIWLWDVAQVAVL